jgi:hypothetical protein
MYDCPNFFFRHDQLLIIFITLVQLQIDMIKYYYNNKSIYKQLTNSVVHLILLIQ